MPRLKLFSSQDSRQKQPPSARFNRVKNNKKCMRGEAYYYDEIKKNISLTITDSARKTIEELALNNEISKSEFLERLMRYDIAALESFLKNGGFEL